MTTEQNNHDFFQTISNLINLTGLKFPPLRTWRTGNTAEDDLRVARFWTGVMALTVTAIAVLTIVIAW